jgi:hypothetical protein
MMNRVRAGSSRAPDPVEKLAATAYRTVAPPASLPLPVVGSPAAPKTPVDFHGVVVPAASRDARSRLHLISMSITIVFAAHCVSATCARQW